MCKCQYCNKEFKNKQALAGHMSHCKLNPNYNEQARIEQQRKLSIAGNNAKRLKYQQIENTRKQRKLICQNCGKEYELNLTDKQFEEGKYSHFCSKICANTRHHSAETKQKISLSIKTIYSEHPELLKNQYTGKNKEKYIAKIKSLSEEQKKNYSNPDNYKYISELIKEGYILNINNYEYKDKLVNYNNFQKHNCIICGKEFYCRIIKSGKIGGGNTCCEECHKKLVQLIGKKHIKK